MRGKDGGIAERRDSDMMDVSFALTTTIRMLTFCSGSFGRVRHDTYSNWRPFRFYTKMYRANVYNAITMFIGLISVRRVPVLDRRLAQMGLSVLNCLIFVMQSIERLTLCYVACHGIAWSGEAWAIFESRSTTGLQFDLLHCNDE